MTPKELLYLEDSLGMEQQLQKKCRDYAGKVSSTQLKSVLTGLATKHSRHFTSLMNQLK